MVKDVDITLIELKQPCTACLITGNLIKEMLDKIKKRLDYVKVEYIELDNLKDIHSIEGLEVEKFPALIVNHEQFTAGSLPMMENLITMIKSEAKINED